MKEKQKSMKYQIAQALENSITNIFLAMAIIMNLFNGSIAIVYLSYVKHTALILFSAVSVILINISLSYCYVKNNLKKEE